MDRPAARERRRRAVPLGLHADGRSRRGAGETRRVLRPGGRVALAVWDAVERNPWALLPAQELAERGLDRAAQERAAAARARSRSASAARSPSCSSRRDSPSCAWRRSTSSATTRASRSCGTPRSTSRAPSTTPCSRARPAEIDEIRRSCAERFAPYTAADGGARDPRAHARGVRERLSWRARARALHPPARRRWDSLRPMIYDDDADLTCSTARPSPSSATAPRATRTRSTSRTPASSVVVGLREDSASVAKAREQGLEVLPVVEAASRGDLVMILLPDELPPRGLGAGDPRRHRRGQHDPVRSRLLDPLRGDRPAGGRRRGDGRAQGARAPRAPPVHRRQRRPRADRRRAGRDRQRARARARLRQGHRLHARRRDRDDVQGRDRDRPVRRAGGALRRRLRARPGRLRDARRSGL